MSSIVNKVKEALNPHSSSSSGQPEGTSGPHNSRAGNAADPRVDSDRDHRAAGGIHSGTTTTGTTGTHGTTGLTGSHGTTGTSGLPGTHGTAGTHALGGDNRGLDGPASKTDGPHNSNLLNKADPRIDSDRDHSKNLGLNPSGTAATGSNTHSTGHTGSTGLGSTGHTGTHTTGTGIGSTGHTGTHGTHNTSGLTGSHGTSGLTGTTGHTTGTGIGSTGHTGTHSEGAHGPHSSRVANAADPRVDSDHDASRTVGGTTGTHGTTGLTGSHGTHNTSGLTGSTGTHGTHNTSGLTGSTGTHGTHGTTGLAGGTHATGPAPNTAGPHKSDALNKLDPRVDSDLDGSKTYGGDKTYTRS